MRGIVCITGLYLPMHLKDFDQHWQHQDIMYNLRAQIEGTGSHSEVMRVNLVAYKLMLSRY